MNVLAMTLLITVAQAVPAGESSQDAPAGPKGPVVLLETSLGRIKLSLDAMEAAGVEIRQVRAMGGGAKSPQWLQTKADIWGKPVVAMDVSEAPCLGAAILAGVGIGDFSSAKEGVDRMVRARRTYEPDPVLHEQYAHKARLFSQIYPTLADLNHQM